MLRYQIGRPVYLECKKDNKEGDKMVEFENIKSEEIKNVFSEGFPDEKARIVQVLKEIDPANSTKWDNITKGGGI